MNYLALEQNTNIVSLTATMQDLGSVVVAKPATPVVIPFSMQVLSSAPVGAASLVEVRLLKDGVAIQTYQHVQMAAGGTGYDEFGFEFLDEDPNAATVTYAVQARYLKTYGAKVRQRLLSVVG